MYFGSVPKRRFGPETVTGDSAHVSTSPYLHPGRNAFSERMQNGMGSSMLVYLLIFREIWGIPGYSLILSNAPKWSVSK